MVYATEKGLDRILEDIPNEKNRETVRIFLEEQRANGVKLSSVVNQAGHVRHWAVFLGSKDFSAASKDDVRRFANLRTVERRWQGAGAKNPTIRTVPIGQTTMNIRKVILKNFMRWQRGGAKTDPYPPEVVWLKQARSKDDETMPVEAVLTRDDLHALIQGQAHVQAKAIIATLYDSGCRASEFCALRIKHVILDEHGAILTLPKDGTNLKTGARRIRVLNCTPFLVSWLNAHPHRKNPNAPLWLALRSEMADPLTSQMLYYFVREWARSAGITKEVWPHLFRHSRATESAREGWPEAVMRAHFGWSRGSDMPSRYVHLAGKDADNYILQAAGKVTGGGRAAAALLPLVCQCGHENPATAEACEKAGCAKPLTVAAAQIRARKTFLHALEGDDELMDTIADRLLAKSIARAQARAASGSS